MQTAYHHLTFADAWTPPGESIATRDITKRCKGSGRAILLNGTGLRQVLCESLLEHKAALVLLANPAVADLWEQPPAVIYRDATGQLRQHTFDFLVKLHSGQRFAVDVRPEHRAKELRETVALIAAQVSDYANGYVVLTDTHLTRDRVHNAETILMSRRGSDPSADKAIGETILTLHGAISIADLMAAANLGSEGFRAIVRSLHRGDLKLHPGCSRIGLRSLVSRPQSAEV